MQWQVFWLVPLFDNLPIRRWQIVVLRKIKKQLELTASGNAPDFNRIPILTRPEVVRDVNQCTKEYTGRADYFKTYMVKEK